MNLNDTSEYHINRIESLDWEITLSSMLENRNSPCREILKNNRTYGNLLYDFLDKKIDFSNIKSFIETGGGYGWLARDFLIRNNNLKAVMLDISDTMLNNQRETLASLNAQFINTDFFSSDNTLIKNSQLIILNEVIGDFPAITGLSLSKKSDLSDNLKTACIDSLDIIEKYSLETQGGTFTFNYGAAKAAEKICSTSVPYAFISEHSCESEPPDELKEILNFNCSGFPEEIKLLGHSEYTVKFSHLEKIAAAWGYRTIRGNYADFIEINFDGRVNYALRSNSSKDDLEILRQFIHDLYKYEYLIFIRNNMNGQV